MANDRPYRTAIIPTGAMTGTTTITSQVFSVEQQQVGTFQPIWTGNPTGTFIVQASLDYVPNMNRDDPNPLNPGTWDTLSASVVNNPAGSAGHTYIPVYGSGAFYLRLSYTNASGSGILSGTFAAKTRG